MFDIIEPGIVKKKAYRPPYKHNREKMEQLENCNYALEIGRGKEMNFSLVGIGGQDIYNGNETLTLGKWKQPPSPWGVLTRSYTGRFPLKVRNRNFLDIIFKRKYHSFISSTATQTLFFDSYCLATDEGVHSCLTLKADSRWHKD